MSIHVPRSAGEPAKKSKAKFVIGLATMFLGSIWMAHYIENRHGSDLFGSHPFEPGAGFASNSAGPADAAPVPAGASDLQVAFSPGERGRTAEGLVVDFVDGVQSGQILVAAYEFTSAPIRAALARAEGRGVDVQAVMDKTQAEPGKFSEAPALAAAGISVAIDCVPAIMHDKFMVANATRVETGSFNYTASAAKRNAENALVFTDVELAKQYQAEFVRLLRESQPLSAGACN